MKKPLVALGTLLVSVICLSLAVASFPQVTELTPSIKNQNTGLTITEAKCSASQTGVSDPSCTLKNDTSKGVGCFVVLWTVTTSSGKTFTITTMEERSLMKSSKRLLRPGEVAECESTGMVTPPPGEAITNIEVGVDYVLFEDGTTVGPDKSKSGSQVRARQLVARYVRKQLLTIYQEDGLPGLMQELSEP